eukprot:UN23962
MPVMLKIAVTSFLIKNCSKKRIILISHPATVILKYFGTRFYLISREKYMFSALQHYFVLTL